MEDQTASPDQLREAFRGIAKDKVRNESSKNDCVGLKTIFHSPSWLN